MPTRLGFFVGLGMGLTFSLGFGAATLLTPQVQAQSAPATPRFEYRVVDHGFDGDRWANELGAQGWRFVGYDSRQAHEMILEREIR